MNGLKRSTLVYLIKNNMSLKQTLNDIIESRGYLSLDEVHTIAKDRGHKESMSERELRPSRSPKVVADKNKKGFITGYRWKEAPVYNENYDKDFIKQRELDYRCPKLI